MVKTPDNDKPDRDKDVRYGHVKSKADIDKIFSEIRDDIGQARSREALTELHRRAGYLITLTYARSWEQHLGDKAEGVRHEAEADFRKTARMINSRAEKIGVKADYDEAWGKMKERA